MTKTLPEPSNAMFESLRLRNFKSYRDSGDIELKPLTIVVGANNAGKSSILQALLLLKQTAEDRSRAVMVNRGPLVDLGGFLDILHRKGKGGSGNEIGIAVTVEVPEEQKEATKKKKKQDPFEMEVAEKLDVRFSFSDTSNEIEVARCTFTQGEKVFDVWDSGNHWSYGEYSDKTHPGNMIRFSHFIPILTPRIIELPDGKRKAEYEIPTGFAYWQVHVWPNILSQIHRIGPLRQRVPWYGGLGVRTSSELGLGGENLIGSFSSRDKVRPSENTLLELVNAWVADNLQPLSKIRLHHVDKSGTVLSMLGDERQGTKGINVAAMGEGISQVLPIIARTLIGRPSECLIVEQPEIHLHPAMQANLGDLFVGAVKAGRQVIIETHSEHLLLRVRRRVADGTLTPDEVSILYVEKEGPESTVRKLHLNGNGHFDDWPKGFFEDAYKEAMALAMEQQKNNK